jgi:hypothetical protein
MTIKLNNKRSVVLALVAALAIAVAAVGYWTTGGTGGGSAATGTSQEFVVTQEGDPVTGLVPGGPAATININIENPADFDQYLTDLEVVVDPAWSAEGGTTPACDAGDFTIVQPTVTSGDLTPGDHDYTATIALENKTTNQDNCKGVTADLIITAS